MSDDQWSPAYQNDSEKLRIPRFFIYRPAGTTENTRLKFIFYQRITPRFIKIPFFYHPFTTGGGKVYLPFTLKHKLKHKLKL